MYDIILLKPAENFFRKLGKNDQERIAKKFKELEKNPELGKPLTGRLTGLFSLRIGDYRAVYQIRHNGLVIYVLRIGHGRNVYG